MAKNTTLIKTELSILGMRLKQLSSHFSDFRNQVFPPKSSAKDISTQVDLDKLLAAIQTISRRVDASIRELDLDKFKN
jgi:hypothetical protein